MCAYQISAEICDEYFFIVHQHKKKFFFHRDIGEEKRKIYRVINDVERFIYERLSAFMEQVTCLIFEPVQR